LKKKLFTSFVILVFILNVFGIYVPYYVARSVLRTEMTERTKSSNNKDHLVKISFDLSETPKEIKWTREEKEFEYNDEMYDIVKIEKRNNKITYYCLRDKDEKDLNQIFNSLLKKKSSSNNSRDINIQKELSKYNLQTDNLFLPFKNTGTAHHFANDLYVSIYNEINLPPPKTVLS
jgi:hypothetical protein